MRSAPRLGSWFLTISILAATGLPGVLAEEPISEEEEQNLDEIERLMQQKVSDLYKERNDEGLRYRRGRYSHNYEKVDADTYLVPFHRDTAGADTLTTERLTLTISREGKKWVVSDEILEDTYQGLHRSVIGDETFHRFEKLSLEREGLTVTATGGSLVLETELGKPSAIFLTGEDLAWTYDAPSTRESRLYEIIMRERPEELGLEPETVWIQCDPVSCESILNTAISGLQESSLDAIDDILQKRYNDWRDESQNIRKENPFSGFGFKPDEEGHRWYTIAIKKTAAERYVGLSYNSFRPKEVSFWASELGTLYAYYSEESLESGEGEYELELRDSEAGRDYRLWGIRGEVEVGVQDAEAVSGDITFRIVTNRELATIPFTLVTGDAMNDSRGQKRSRLFVNSLQDGSGEELTWVRTGVASGLVILPNTVPEETPLTIRMEFENQDSLLKLTPSFTYMNRSGWLPFVRSMSMINEFDLTVTSPSKFKLLGIGEKVSEEKVGNFTVSRWVSDDPVVFPTLIFGDYNEATSKVAAKKPDGTPIPVTVHVDRDTMGNFRATIQGGDASSLVEGGDMGGVSFSVDGGRISPKQLQQIANSAANSINFYQELLGVEYPYEKLDLVNDPSPALYGQAPSSLIFLGTLAFLGEGTLADRGGGGNTFFLKGLVPHEVAHQWWGSTTTNRNFFNYWFVESLAEYSSALYLEARFGAKTYQDQVEVWKREIASVEMIRGVQEADTVQYGSRRAALYSKGPYAFHIMRQTFGDERFLAFLKNLAQEFEGEEIVTRDIQKVAEKSLGMEMEWFFDQWIRGSGMPELTVSYDVRQVEDGTYVLEGEIKQRVVLGKDRDVLEDEFFQGILPISVEMGKEERKYKVVLKGATTPFRFPVPQKPKKVTVNKYGELLAHLEIEKS